MTARLPLGGRMAFLSARPLWCKAGIREWISCSLGNSSGSATVGHYSAAYKPINMVLNFGASAAGTLFPYLVQESRGHPSGSFERVVRVFLVVARAVALVLGES